MGQPYVVALTGGIAAGKSAVTRRFEALGVGVHDADIAARAVVAPGSEGLHALVDTFGQEILNSRGELDRSAMRQRVFGDDQARRTLEAITHPRVRQWLRDHVSADPGPYCVLAIPLLAENIDHYRWVDRILVVDAPDDIRLARLITRDGIDEDLATRILARQANREQRLAIADDVLVNDRDEASLDAHVDQLHQRYLHLATLPALPRTP
ncbi:dephospho-CoA kinase [Dyella sp.]|uniref:dephospho-CoA kinase n=1 Tax=Dyella sp. TaxID=1869338 RepID=UPI0039C8A3A6